MTPEDKARIEEIRKKSSSLESKWPGVYENAEAILFLLARLDETSSRLASAHAALRGLLKFNEGLCEDVNVSKNYPSAERARKALDGSTDPDTGTKGSLGEE